MAARCRMRVPSLPPALQVESLRMLEHGVQAWMLWRLVGREDTCRRGSHQHIAACLVLMGTMLLGRDSAMSWAAALWCIAAATGAQWVWLASGAAAEWLRAGGLVAVVGLWWMTTERRAGVGGMQPASFTRVAGAVVASCALLDFGAPGFLPAWVGIRSLVLWVAGIAAAASVLLEVADPAPAPTEGISVDAPASGVATSQGTLPPALPTAEPTPAGDAPTLTSTFTPRRSARLRRSSLAGHEKTAASTAAAAVVPAAPAPTRVSAPAAETCRAPVAHVHVEEAQRQPQQEPNAGSDMLALACGIAWAAVSWARSPAANGVGVMPMVIVGGVILLASMFTADHASQDTASGRARRVVMALCLGLAFAGAHSTTRQRLVVGGGTSDAASHATRHNLATVHLDRWQESHEPAVHCFITSTCCLEDDDAAPSTMIDWVPDVDNATELVGWLQAAGSAARHHDTPASLLIVSETAELVGLYGVAHRTALTALLSDARVHNLYHAVVRAVEEAITTPSHGPGLCVNVTAASASVTAQSVPPPCSLLDASCGPLWRAGLRALHAAVTAWNSTVAQVTNATIAEDRQPSAAAPSTDVLCFPAWLADGSAVAGHSGMIPVAVATLTSHAASTSRRPCWHTVQEVALQFELSAQPPSTAFVAGLTLHPSRITAPVALAQALLMDEWLSAEDRVRRGSQPPGARPDAMGWHIRRSREARIVAAAMKSLALAANQAA